MGLPAKKGCKLDSDREQIVPLPNPAMVFLTSLRFDIIAISDRIEMRQDELAHPSLRCHLTALPGVQMGGAWTIGWERTIEHRQVSFLT